MQYSRYLKYYLILASILAFTLLEILTICYRWPRTNREVQSIIFFIAGLGISLLPLSVTKISIPQSKHYFSQKTIFYLLFSGVIALIGIIFSFCPQLFQKIPISPQTADMIPILSAMAERYTTGQKVYAFIEISDPMYPIYLPALWLPFIIPNTFHFDPRWLIQVFLATAIILTVFATPSKKVSIRQFMIFMPLFLLVWGITHHEITLITMTQEGIIIAYYMFFAIVLLRRPNNLYWISVTLMLCLLSRFTLLFFFAFYLLFIWRFENSKKAYKILGITSLLVLIIMTLSQAIFHLEIFLGLSHNYMQAVAENKAKYTDVIQYSMGIAKFFKYENLSILHRLHFIFQIIPLVGAFLYFYYVKPQINKSLFLLCIAKLSLVLFFNLLIIPYTYLFYTSILYSIVILYVYAQGDIPLYQKNSTLMSSI